MNNRLLISILGGVVVLAAGFYLGLQWQGRMVDESDGIDGCRRCLHCRPVSRPD